MRFSFYDSPEYKKTQSEITKRKHGEGVYEHPKRQVARTCEGKGCTHVFVVQSKDPKRFCSRSCAATYNNSRRQLSAETKQKISNSLTGKKYPSRRGVTRVPRVESICQNPLCGRVFTHERYRERVYCSNDCAMQVVGSRPTSPKASRGKSGIRPDIDPDIYFYSRWEANMARLYNYLSIPWLYAPKTFDIGGQTYTPDFYLPESNTYVEVKNYWNDYSRIRDMKFRESYPELLLEIVLKDEYLALEKKYAHLILAWEYKNSPVPATSSADLKTSKCSSLRNSSLGS